MRILKLMQEGQRFSSTEQNIIDYLLAHPGEVAELSIRELAERTYTSPAAVFRLCQKFGLKGYNEFKIKFISETSRASDDEKTLSLRRPITDSDSAADIVRKMAALEIEAIEETKNELDEAQLMRIADMMCRASIIDFYAYDQNYYLAKAAVYNLLQTKHIATCNNSLNSQLAQALNSDKRHLAFIISRTGENQRLIRAMQILKKHGTATVAFTARRDTAIARLADEYIYIANTADYLDMGGMMFSVGVRYCQDTLFGLLLARDFHGIESFDAEMNENMGTYNDPHNRLW